jgi:hypothetical protein
MCKMPPSLDAKNYGGGGEDNSMCIKMAVGTPDVTELH